MTTLNPKPPSELPHDVIGVILEFYCTTPSDIFCRSTYRNAQEEKVIPLGLLSSRWHKACLGHEALWGQLAQQRWPRWVTRQKKRHITDRTDNMCPVALTMPFAEFKQRSIAERKLRPLNPSTLLDIEECGRVQGGGTELEGSTLRFDFLCPMFAEAFTETDKKTEHGDPVLFCSVCEKCIIPVRSGAQLETIRQVTLLEAKKESSTSKTKSGGSTADSAKKPKLPCIQIMDVDKWDGPKIAPTLQVVALLYGNDPQHRRDWEIQLQVLAENLAGDVTSLSLNPLRVFHKGGGNGRIGGVVSLADPGMTVVPRGATMYEFRMVSIDDFRKFKGIPEVELTEKKSGGFLEGIGSWLQQRTSSLLGGASTTTIAGSVEKRGPHEAHGDGVPAQPGLLLANKEGLSTQFSRGLPILLFHPTVSKSRVESTIKYFRPPVPAPVTLDGKHVPKWYWLHGTKPQAGGLDGFQQEGPTNTTTHWHPDQLFRFLNSTLATVMVPRNNQVKGCACVAM